MASGDGCHPRLISVNVTFFPLISLFSALYLINKVVMAIHSYVIPFHINTYISDPHYKARNSGAPLDSWQYVIGCTVVLRMKLTLALIHERKGKDRRGCFIIFVQNLLSTCDIFLL